MSDPCPYDPRELAGQPMGQFHCPVCGEMQIAGMAHLPPMDEWPDPPADEGSDQDEH